MLKNAAGLLDSISRRLYRRLYMSLRSWATVTCMLLLIGSLSPAAAPFRGAPLACFLVPVYSNSAAACFFEIPTNGFREFTTDRFNAAQYEVRFEFHRHNTALNQAVEKRENRQPESCNVGSSNRAAVIRKMTSRVHAINPDIPCATTKLTQLTQPESNSD